MNYFEIVKKNEGKFTVGTKFVGNINGAVMEVVKVGTRPQRSSGTIVTYKCLKTNRLFYYGVEALERCDVTIIN